MKKLKTLLIILISLVIFSLFVFGQMNIVEAANAPTYKELMNAKNGSYENLIKFFEKYNYNISAQDIINAYKSNGTPATEAVKWVSGVYDKTQATNYNSKIGKEYNNDQAKIEEAKKKLKKINGICYKNRALYKDVYDLAYEFEAPENATEYDGTKQEELKSWNAEKILDNYTKKLSGLQRNKRRRN